MLFEFHPVLLCKLVAMTKVVFKCMSVHNKTHSEQDVFQ